MFIVVWPSGPPVTSLLEEVIVIITEELHEYFLIQLNEISLVYDTKVSYLSTILLFYFHRKSK